MVISGLIADDGCDHSGDAAKLHVENKVSGLS